MQTTRKMLDIPDPCFITWSLEGFAIGNQCTVADVGVTSVLPRLWVDDNGAAIAETAKVAPKMIVLNMLKIVRDRNKAEGA